MIIGLIILNLILQFYYGFSYLLRMALLGLQHQKMILHIMINTAHALFFTRLVVIICKLHPKFPGAVFGPERIADIRCKVDSAEA